MFVQLGVARRTGPSWEASRFMSVDKISTYLFSTEQAPGFRALYTATLGRTFGIFEEACMYSEVPRQWLCCWLRVKCHVGHLGRVYSSAQDDSRHRRALGNWPTTILGHCGRVSSLARLGVSDIRRRWHSTFGRPGVKNHFRWRVDGTFMFLFHGFGVLAGILAPITRGWACRHGYSRDLDCT